MAAGRGVEIKQYFRVTGSLEKKHPEGKERRCIEATPESCCISEDKGYESESEVMRFCSGFRQYRRVSRPLEKET